MTACENHFEVVQGIGINNVNIYSTFNNNIIQYLEKVIMKMT